MTHDTPGTASNMSAKGLVASSGALHQRPLFSPEMELLFCCGGPGIRSHDNNHFSEIVGKGIDWESIFNLALWHHMLPLLYWNLAQREDGQRNELHVPPRIMEVFKSAYLRNVSLALRMTGDLIAILEKLEAAGVTVVPYKGPVLASRLYGNLGLRRSVDLDIIVRKKDLEKARKALIDLGYVPSLMLHRTAQDFQVESRYSERFDRPGSVVELHWAFTNRDVAFPLTLDDLMPRLITHSLSGKPIQVFAPEDTLLILCVHGAKHGWARLEWICGIAELIHSGDQIVWPDLVSRAIETRSLRRLLLGLCLAHDLYRAPLPQNVKDLIRGDRQIPLLAAAVSSSLSDSGRRAEGIQTFGTLDHDLFHFRLGDRFPDSLRYLIYRVTTPSRPERWSTISIGGRAITLHSFTRPFGIVAKLVPAVWRRYGLNRVSSRGHRSDRRHGE